MYFRDLWYRFQTSLRQVRRLNACLEYYQRRIRELTETVYRQQQTIRELRELLEYSQHMRDYHTQAQVYYQSPYDTTEE